MQYFFINETQAVCGTCSDDLWPTVQDEMTESGLVQVEENEYEIVRFLQRHGLDEILRLASKWGLDQGSANAKGD